MQPVGNRAVFARLIARPFADFFKCVNLVRREVDGRPVWGLVCNYVHIVKYRLNFNGSQLFYDIFLKIYYLIKNYFSIQLDDPKRLKCRFSYN